MKEIENNTSAHVRVRPVDTVSFCRRHPERSRFSGGARACPEPAEGDLARITAKSASQYPSSSSPPAFPLREQTTKRIPTSQHSSPHPCYTKTWFPSPPAEDLRSRAFLGCPRGFFRGFVPPSPGKARGAALRADHGHRWNSHVAQLEFPHRSLVRTGHVRTGYLNFRPGRRHRRNSRHGPRSFRRAHSASHHRRGQPRHRCALLQHQRRRRPFCLLQSASRRLLRARGCGRHVASDHAPTPSGCGRRRRTGVPPHHRRRPGKRYCLGRAHAGRDSAQRRFYSARRTGHRRFPAQRPPFLRSRLVLARRNPRSSQPHLRH